MDIGIEHCNQFPVLNFEGHWAPPSAMLERTTTVRSIEAEAWICATLHKKGGKNWERPVAEGKAAEGTAAYFQVEGLKYRVRRLVVLYFPRRKGFILWEGGITEPSGNLIFLKNKQS